MLHQIVIPCLAMTFACQSRSDTPTWPASGSATGSAGSAASAGSATVAPPGDGPTLDIAEFQPPFDQLPLAHGFIARNHITKVTTTETSEGAAKPEPPEVTEYNADGLPVRRTTPSGVFELTYIDAAQPMPKLAADAKTTIGVVDRNKRLLKTHAADVDDTYKYDAAGHVTRTAHDDGPKHYEELRSYDADGHLVKRTRGEVGSPPFETLDYRVAGGRIVEIHGNKPGYPNDRYMFRYDPAGQIVEMKFLEDNKDIYRRTYTYDRDGFVTRVDQHASVPAMGSSTTEYAYEPRSAPR